MSQFDKRGGQHLRIATWYLNHARFSPARRRHVLDRIERIQADVWVLTETRDDLVLLGFNHQSTPPRVGCKGERERWVTIWSRFPLLSCIPTAQPARSICVVVEAPRPLVVYGTVLPWHADKGEGAPGAAFGWREFDRVVALQGDDWERLSETHADVDRVVAGDFNQVLDGAHPAGYGSPGRVELKRRLTDAHLTCLTDEHFAATGKLRERRNIDHICASKGRLIQTCAWEGTADVEGRSTKLELSDHNGVAVDWEPGG